MFSISNWVYITEIDIQYQQLNFRLYEWEQKKKRKLKDPFAKQIYKSEIFFFKKS